MDLLINIDRNILSIFDKFQEYLYRPVPAYLEGHSFAITCGILVIYLFGVWVGPKLMKNMKPFNVSFFSTVYNIIQIMFNSFIVYLGLRAMGLGYIDYSNPLLLNSPIDNYTIGILWLYYVNKFMDLTDTLFIILKKDNRRLSLLHVSHHLLITLNISIYVNLLGKIYTGTIIIAPLLNSIVHMFMYSYYLISSFKPSIKTYKLWMTNIQMIQFILVLIHGIVTFFFDSTHYALSLVEGFWAFYMVYMFGKFYISQLRRNKSNNIKQDNED